MGSLVFHTLGISYINNEESERIYLAMDLHDLKKLRNSIDRAIKKEAALKKAVNDPLIPIDQSEH